MKIQKAGNRKKTEKKRKNTETSSTSVLCESDSLKTHT